MARVNRDWGNQEAEVRRLFGELMSATSVLNEKFGVEHVGRKFSDGKWETRFNRALFEVEAYYFGKIPGSLLALVPSNEAKARFEQFCGDSAEFLDSIETSTKNLQRYRRRYELFQEFVNATFGAEIDYVPLPNL
jgi:hypothetical protein